MSTRVGALFIATTVVSAETGAEDLARGHTQFTSVVTKKAGALVVTTPNGATHQLNENMARRHGQKPFTAAAKTELEQAGITIDSMSDHTVSQSLYLRDPDGNEIELYVDADESVWKKATRGCGVADQASCALIVGSEVENHRRKEVD